MTYSIVYKFPLIRADFEKLHNNLISDYSKTEVMQHGYKEKTIAWANFNIEIRRVVLEDKRRQTYMASPHAFNESVTAHNT
jgi:hypothetical protein